MAVRKVAGKKKTAKKVKKGAKRKGAGPKKAPPAPAGKAPPDVKAMQLPTKPKAPVDDMQRYMFLLYGRLGIGKTTAFSTFPGTMFLTTEPGTKGLEIFEFNEPYGITDWTVMLRAVELLEEHPELFKNVVIDTADCAYDMCLDYVCKKLQIPYPGQDIGGENDWGKSWNAVKSEFMSVVHRITRTGRGLGFTSHATESTVESRSGGKFTRIIPSMGKQARKVITALVDYVFYVDYVKVNDQSMRIVLTQGDELVTAKARKSRFGRFPQFMELPDPDIEGNETPYEAFKRGFHAEHPGIDLLAISAAPDTAGPLDTMVGKTQAKKKLAQQRGGQS